MTALEAARAYVAAGLSVIPIRPDGSKAPAVASWKVYQGRKPTDQELQDWFGNGKAYGPAVVCGAVSRNLEVLDFDSPPLWKEWRDAVLAKDPHALDGRPVVRTPRGGAHVYFFRDVAGPSRKVAKDPGGKTLVEVKAEGGYVLAPGCPVGCHADGREYVWEQPLGV